MKKITQKMCDSLLTPIIKKEIPYCEACGSPTNVAHHFIEKSRSANLRYDVDNNLIALCNPCHVKIHNRFGNSIMGSFDVASIIINKRGKKWLNKLKIEGRKIIKVNQAHYDKQYEILKNRLDKTTC